MVVCWDAMKVGDLAERSAVSSDDSMGKKMAAMRAESTAGSSVSTTVVLSV